MSGRGRIRGRDGRIRFLKIRRGARPVSSLWASRFGIPPSSPEGGRPAGQVIQPAPAIEAIKPPGVSSAPTAGAVRPGWR